MINDSKNFLIPLRSFQPKKFGGRGGCSQYIFVRTCGHPFRDHRCFKDSSVSLRIDYDKECSSLLESVKTTSYTSCGLQFPRWSRHA